MYKRTEQSKKLHQEERLHTWTEKVRSEIQVHVKTKNYTYLHTHLAIFVKHFHQHSDYIDALKDALQQEYPEGVQRVDKLLLLL